MLFVDVRHYTRSVFGFVDAKGADQIPEMEKKLADQIMTILEHYKQEDPVGIPGAKIPDPMPIPKMKHTFPVATMTFNNMNVNGLSKFRIVHIKSEISSMEVSIVCIKVNLGLVLYDFGFRSTRL